MSNTSKQIWDILAEDLDGFLSAEEIRTLRKTEWAHGTAAEFALAMKQCAARDLNPFGGHVYPRNDRTKENGQWRDVLTHEQVDELLATHGETMRAHGYLDQRGRPTF